MPILSFCVADMAAGNLSPGRLLKILTNSGGFSYTTRRPGLALYVIVLTVFVTFREGSVAPAQPNVKTAASALLPFLPVAVFFSGLTGLVYESLWMRSFGLIFGNTTYAVSVVLAVFMG